MPLVMTLVSQKGGVGKTALARSIAVALARAKVRVLLADCDTRQSTAVHWSRTRSEQRLIPTINTTSAEDLDTALREAETFDAVVIDLPGQASRTTLEAAQRSHLVVHPTGPTLDDLYPSVLLFHELTGAGIPKQRLAFVLCRTLAKSEEDGARDYLQRAGYEVMPGSLAEKLDYRRAFNRGASAVETDDAALNAQANALIDGILRKLNDEVEKQKRKRSQRTA